MADDPQYEAELVQIPTSDFSNTCSPEIKQLAQEYLPKLRRRRGRTTTVATVDTQGKARAVFRTNEMQLEAARLAGDKTIRTRVLRPHGQKAKGDKIAAKAQGKNERTVRRERTRVEKLGAKVLARLRSETTLRTDTQIDALLTLPVKIRDDLIRRAFTGEHVNAIDVIARRKTEERTGVRGQFNALRDVWEKNPAGRMPFLKWVHAQSSSSVPVHFTDEEDEEHLDLMGPLGRATYKTLTGPGHSEAMDVLEGIESEHILEAFEPDHE